MVDQIKLFDIPGAVREGFAFGTQQRQLREGEQKQSALSQLAAQAYGSQGAERQGLVQQAIATDPRAGFALGENLQSDEDRRNKTMVNMARMLTTAPEQLRPGLYASMVPTLRNFGLSELPEAYTPETAPVIDQAASSLVSAWTQAEGTPAQIQAFNAMAAGLTPEDVERARRIELGLDPRASSAAIGYEKITLPGGREALVALDPRQVGAQVLGTGQTYGSGVRAPGGSSLSPAQDFSTLSQMFGVTPSSTLRTPDRNRQVGGVPNSFHLTGEASDWPVPAAMKPQFIAQARRMGYQAIDEGDHVHLEPPARGMAAGGSNPFIGPSEAQTAAQVEAARQGVQTQFLPEQERIKTQAEIDRASGVARAKSEAERDAQAPQRAAKYRQALATAQNVETSIDRALGMIGPESTGFVGARLRGVEGSPAYNLQAEIETIKANLGFDRLQEMRDNSPTGGALGQVAIQELVALQSTVANLDPNQSGDQLRANIGRIKEHYARWKAAIQQAQAAERAQSTAPTSASSGAAGDPLGIL